MFKIELGSEVESVHTGFKGIVTARSEHVNGCDRYWVQPRVGKDMKLPDGSWIDENELKVTKAPRTRKKEEKHEKTGGFPSPTV